MAKLRMVLGLVVLVCFSTLALAKGEADVRATELRQTLVRGTVIRHLIRYAESGHWKVQVFESTGNELEDLIQDETFQDSEQAIQTYERALGQSFKEGFSTQIQVSTTSPTNPPSVPENGESLWTVTQSWDEEWEQKYSDWVRDIVDENFFLDHQISTDCADVIVASIWIFAYEHGLPVANTLLGSGRLLGSMSMKAEWRNLPTAEKWFENQRFLAALNYILKSTNTRSLEKDSYPIAINHDSLRPGAHHLEYHEVGGHAQLVKSIRITEGKTATIMTLNSTLPAKARRLILRDYVFGDQPPVGIGFLNLRRVELHEGRWFQRAPESHMHYSLEQYAPEFMNGLGLFSMAVKAHLSGNMSLDLREWKSTLRYFEVLVDQRIQVVLEGFKACQEFDCTADAALYDEWSTPGRDDTLRRLILAIVKTVEAHPDAESLYHETIGKSKRYDHGQSLSMLQIQQVFVEGRFTSDPRLSIRSRWGQE